MHKSPVYILLILLLVSLTGCQHDTRNPYDLDIITRIGDYKSVIREDSMKMLVNIDEYIPGIILDIRYATDNNFTGEVIYKEPKAYARIPVARALLRIQEELKENGLGLKVFDAYRPYAATLRFYEVYPDTMFVAAPWKGSRHNRGCAVDVTLVDLDTGNEIPMPTPFDDFSEKAGVNYTDLPDEILMNRETLIGIMTKYGFSVYPHEWWHFDYTGWENFKLMDISFDELDKIDYKLVFFR